MAQHARIKRTPPPDGARRRWWQNRLLQLLAAFVLLCGVAAAGLKLYTDYTNSHFQVTFYRVTSSHVSEKLRVLFLSDLHLREYGEHNEELIQTVQELDPDLILLGGDLVTFPNPEYENMLSLCRSLADVAPLYGVLGNHESEMIYGGVDDQLAEKFSEAGVQLLRNETRTIQIGGKQRGAHRAGRCPEGLLQIRCQRLCGEPEPPVRHLPHLHQPCAHGLCGLHAGCAL